MGAEKRESVKESLCGSAEERVDVAFSSFFGALSLSLHFSSFPSKLNDGRTSLVPPAAPQGLCPGHLCGRGGRRLGVRPRGGHGRPRRGREDKQWSRRRRSRPLRDAAGSGQPVLVEQQIFWRSSGTRESASNPASPCALARRRNRARLRGAVGDPRRRRSDTPKKTRSMAFILSFSPSHSLVSSLARFHFLTGTRLGLQASLRVRSFPREEQEQEKKKSQVAATRKRQSLFSLTPLFPRPRLKKQKNFSTTARPRAPTAPGSWPRSGRRTTGRPTLCWARGLARRSGEFHATPRRASHQRRDLSTEPLFLISSSL